MPIFEKFTLKNYRGFQHEQTLAFGIPSVQNVGSGITYIVGANNSGKTTIIEALSLKKDEKLRSSERLNSGNPEFVLWGPGDVILRKVSLIRPESYTFVESPILLEKDSFEIISSRRHWTSNAEQNITTNYVLAQTGVKYNRNSGSVQVSAILKNIEKDHGLYEQFIKLVKQVIPEFSKFTVGYEDREYIEYISGSGIRHKSDFLGDGVISVIRILAHLFTKNKNPLIIDEPELSLHPLGQKRLMQLIAEYSKERQIIISTHSPYFVEWEYIKNGAKLNRIVKEEDKVSKIYTLKDYNTYKPLITGSNWQQPYLADVVAKEIFFQENILFLEGQEDVGLLRDHLKGTDINIFGYGVRGYNGFEFAFTLAKDLGIKKACVLLDSPTEDALENPTNENTIRQKLVEKFPEYKVLQWNKNDIRDKEVHTSKEKTGYFTKDGKLKAAAELDDFQPKISEIKEYLK